MRDAFVADAALRALAPRMLLALALLVVQLGALTHLIGHAGAAPLAAAERIDHSESGHGGERLPALCLQCVALTGLDLPLADATPQCVGPDARFDRPHGCERGRTRAERRTPRCRAPPAVPEHL